ncbi:hypothetical protein SAMN03097708_02150 [Thiohalomonas denitrificans]|uniref:ATP-grasp domain-containing protein n=1 Tax=Thiohalomonas denitrificans TaxID=415747 RepID=A0A1G5QIF5_9GAMM|nr:hypothetical protein SAMN03097708_02150 [Thiohalomonas denitrificans]
MTNLLLFGDANSRACIASIRALKGKNCRIHIAVQGGGLSWMYRVLPYAYYWLTRKVRVFSYSSTTEACFLASLDSLRRLIGAFSVLPMGESLVRTMLKNHEKLSKKGIFLISPAITYNEYCQLSNKESFCRLCESYGIAAPKIIKMPSRFAQSYLCKPKEYGVHKTVLTAPMLVRNGAEHDCLINSEIDFNRHFFQEYIEGESYYYCALFRKGAKQLHFSQKNLIQQPKGKSIIKAIPYDLDAGVIDKIDSMMRGISYDGVMMFELRKTNNTGQFVAIECNPRLWGPLQLPLDNNVNFVTGLVFGKFDEPAERYKYGYVWSGGLPIFKNSFDQYGYQVWVGGANGLRFLDIWKRFDTLIYYLIDRIHGLIKK